MFCFSVLFFLMEKTVFLLDWYTQFYLWFITEAVSGYYMNQRSIGHDCRVSGL
jgi:hypothetical protein